MKQQLTQPPVHLALKNDGSLRVRDDNFYFQPGEGTNANQNQLRHVSAVLSICSVYAKTILS